MGNSTKTLVALGFITVRQHQDHGYFGGYLILNQLARPLEFHCTLPVKPSRAQSLLYGSTLDDFVCGEQIAKALVTRAKLKPSLILTDSSSVLAFENVGDEPIGLVKTTEAMSRDSVRTPQSNAIELKRLQSNVLELWVSPTSLVNASLLNDVGPQLAPNFDVSEPFQRIAEALLEAHPIMKAA